MSRLRPWLSALRQFGFDPVTTVKAIQGVPRYFRLLVSALGKFKKSKFRLSPVWSDYQQSAGSARGHYFWQDLICARWIFESGAKNHFDCGSRIDGFIAHLLSFTEVTLLDIRPVELQIKGLQYILGNAQESLSEFAGKFSSVSSLHSIEHFGLGRYGDPLQVDGHLRGLQNLGNCVKIDGLFYVSFPIGSAEVQFNAQRIIDPLWPVENLPDFRLEEFVLIPWVDAPVHGLSPVDVDKNISGQAGLYKFRRVTKPK